MRNPKQLLSTRTGALLLSGVLVCLALTTVSRVHASELRRSAIVKAVQAARDSIVNIHGQKTLSGGFDQAGDGGRRVNGMGTGVVIDERGYIVTNHHVVQGVRRIQVTLADGKTHYGRLISYDRQTDLAVIKVNINRKLPVVNLGTSSDLMAGETVIAVGNAYGYEHTVTRGIVSALHRTVQVSDTQDYKDLIQTDASINPGNSGGPLLNIDGEMIGINVAVRAGAQGIGFAIPVDKVLEIASGLLSVKKVDNHWHGLETRGSSKEGGLVVTSIEQDSPGAKGGLKKGDVIVDIEEFEILRTLDLERALLGRKSGEEVELTVNRDRKPVKLSIVMASLPTYRPSTVERSWKTLGVRVQQVPPQKFRTVSTRYRGGLAITAVRPDSPAARQGIRKGDVLVGMHIWETVSLENLSYVLNRPDLEDLTPLKFYILRGDETLFGHISLNPHISRR